MKQILLFALLTSFTIHVFAQHETFGVVSYKPVKGWKKERTDKFVSFSKTDEAKGTFCMISIYPAGTGNSDSKTNFDSSWQKIVRGPLGAGDPKMETASTENGWELQTGSAQFDKEGLTGIAMLVTASNNGTIANMLVLYNSDAYNAQLNEFISSIELEKIPQTKSNKAATRPDGNATSVVGLWRDNVPETRGYVNGRPQYTAGYFRREYTFNTNGTYTFLYKMWSTSAKNILFVYEKGTYIINGNKLTIHPASGKSEEWTKGPGGSTTAWGKRVRSENKKLVSTTYTFEITTYYEQTALNFIYNTSSERESNPDNKENNGSRKFSYTLAKSGSDITLPPDFRITQ